MKFYIEDMFTYSTTIPYDSVLYLIRDDILSLTRLVNILDSFFFFFSLGDLKSA